jgi:Fe-S-cluster containining protein
MSLSDLCNGVFSSAKALSEGIEEPLKPEGLIDLVNQAIHLSNWLLEEIEERHIPDFEDIACKKGCSWCCYKQVGVSPLEVFLIAEHLKNKGIKVSLEDIKSRLTALDQITNGLPSEARLSAQLPCAFLVEDSCSIYEVRPLACRGGNSIDADLCRRHVEDMENVQKEEELEGRPYWIHAVPFHVMRVLREGLTTGMKKWDLGQEKLELTAATRIALQEKDALENWIAGKDIFANGRIKLN